MVPMMTHSQLVMGNIDTIVKNTTIIEVQNNNSIL